MHIERYPHSRYWGVYDDAGVLVCVTVYKKGAQEVVRRLQDLDSNHNSPRPPPAPHPLLPPPATRRRWRRALALAALLMKEAGDHTAALTAMRQALTGDTRGADTACLHTSPRHKE
jgi:hypothetical protein